MFGHGKRCGGELGGDPQRTIRPGRTIEATPEGAEPVKCSCVEARRAPVTLELCVELAGVRRVMLLCPAHARGWRAGLGSFGEPELPELEPEPEPEPQRELW